MPKYEVYDAYDAEGERISSQLVAYPELPQFPDGTVELLLGKTFYAKNLAWAKVLFQEVFLFAVDPPAGWSLPPQTPYNGTGCAKHYLPLPSTFPVWLHESGVERCAGCVLDNDGAV